MSRVASEASPYSFDLNVSELVEGVHIEISDLLIGGIELQRDVDLPRFAHKAARFFADLDKVAGCASPIVDPLVRHSLGIKVLLNLGSGGTWREITLKWCYRCTVSSFSPSLSDLRVAEPRGNHHYGNHGHGYDPSPHQKHSNVCTTSPSGTGVVGVTSPFHSQ